MSFENWKSLAENLEGQEVSIKGYLYQTPDERWILAETPDLKSCCVGASHQIDRQILLSGPIPQFKKNVPVEVKGTFHISPKYGENGILTEKYVLTDISILQTQNKIPYWTISLVILAYLFVRLLKRHSFN